jgi:phosphoglycolate phosphatase
MGLIYGKMSKTGGAKMPKLAIFDLDGTICNTIEDLAVATNHAMSALGYPTHSVEQYKIFVGNGIPKLMERSLPDGHKSSEEVLKAKDIMLSYYKEHYADYSAPYEGIIPLLKSLKAQGVGLAVCTNKAHFMAATIVDKLFHGLFDIVIGQSDAYPLKPDPACPLWIAEQLGSKPSEVIFVGDSGVDMKTGKNAGFTAVGVSWGFRTVEELRENGADYIINKADELLEIIEKV